jgi:glyoxylase-like metal-dependent hydrolase (beta-lactamase superfamily II)
MSARQRLLRGVFMGLVPLVAAVGAATATRAQQAGGAEVLAQAVDALGGRTSVLAAHSLVIEGTGINPNLLEQMRPEDPPLVWALPQFREAIDLDHGRYQVKLVRRPAFPAVFDNWPQDARLDGAVAYNGGPAPQRLTVDDAIARHKDMLHHPLALVRAAMEPGAHLSAARLQSAVRAVDITTAEGDKLTLAIDRTTHRPAWIRSMSEHAMLGDVVVESRFDGYALEEPSGLILPRHMVSRTDGTVDYDLQLLSNTVDGDVADLAAPASTRSQPAPPPTPEVISSTEIASGVFFLTGRNPGWNSVLIEFGDHLTLIEAPLSEARALALFAKAKALRPDKPLTELVVSHFHVDHASGFRAAVAAGLTVITQQGNEAFLRDVARRPFTIRPDVLARNPRPLKIRSFDDSLTLRDAAREVQLLHVRNSSHGDTLLMAYLPKDRILINADLFYDPKGQIMPHAVLFQRDVLARGLKVDLNVPLHGAGPTDEATFLAIEKTLESGARH